MEGRYRNEIRGVFTLLARSQKANKKRLAQHRFLLPFLQEYNYRKYIKFKFCKTINLIIFIQNRFKNTLVI
jgi:hypothetical protein